MTNEQELDETQPQHLQRQGGCPGFFAEVSELLKVSPQTF